MEFDDLVQRWKGLIMKAAQEYQIPGRLDFDDCVQVALIALADIHRRSIGTPFDPEVDPIGFEKCVKSAIFHALVDAKRKEQSWCRDYRKEDNPLPSMDTDGEFQDFFSGLESRDDAPDNVIECEEILEMLSSRLSTCTTCNGICKCGRDHQLVLRLLIDPTPELLELLRAESVVKKVTIKKTVDPDTKVEFTTEHITEVDCSITRVKQVQLERYLGWTKQQVGDAVWQIRQRIKDFRPSAPYRKISRLFYYFGLTDGTETGIQIGIRIGVSITYELLLQVMATDERKILSYLSREESDPNLSLSQLAIILQIDEDRLRDALTRMRIRLELLLSGAPAAHVAGCFKDAA